MSDDDDVLRRHDYEVEVNGGAAIAHSANKPKTVDSLVLTTRRRVYRRNPHARP